MRQQLSEDYLGFKNWFCDGDVLPWLQTNPTYNGTITTQCDAADYAADARDNASVEALADGKKVIIKPYNGIVSIEFRFRFDGAEDDQHVLQLFAAAGVDHYRWVDALTIDQGTQDSTSEHFIDTVVSATEIWHTAATELSKADYMGGYTMNTHGYDRFWFVASTLDTANGGANLYIDWKAL